MVAVPKVEGSIGFSWVHIHEPFEVSQIWVIDSKEVAQKHVPEYFVTRRAVYKSGRWVLDEDLNLPAGGINSDDCNYCREVARDFAFDQLIANSRKAYGTPRTLAEVNADHESKKDSKR